MGKQLRFLPRSQAFEMESTDARWSDMVDKVSSRSAEERPQFLDRVGDLRVGLWSNEVSVTVGG
jgi:hypothetical protein